MTRKHLVTIFGACALGFAAQSAAEAQLICRLTPNANPHLIARKYRLRLVDFTPGAPFVLFAARNEQQAAIAQRRLQRERTVVWAEDNAEISTPEGTGLKGGVFPAVGDRNALYAANDQVLDQIRWSDTLAFSSGRPVTVAVLDTGLAPSHAYLWSKVVASMNAVESGEPAHDIERGQDSNGNGSVDEAAGHGSMVAGIVDQVAPLANLAIARIADSDGNATAWTLVEGLAFAVTSGAEVANVSLGSLEQIVALTDVMDWCEEKNLLVVAAVGNNNIEQAIFPARISKVICVAGVGPDLKKAPFSNWEGTVDASAPAVGIVSQSHTANMGVWSGTSFAAPFVTGAIADCLRRTARPVPAGNWRDYLEESGRDLNALNPSFEDHLGTLLDIPSLNSRVQAGNP